MTKANPAEHRTTPKPFVFVLMPFEEIFTDVYKLGIKAACADAGTYCERLDEQIFDESMLERVYNQIAKADLVIADMTGRNPNVFYEVGYAHALGKRVVLVTQKAEDIPFDLKHYYHIVYGGSISKLKEALTPRVQWYAYHSGSQRARVVTEAWGEKNLYCPNCSSSSLSRLRNNTKASDFSCPSCGFWYQLKCQRPRIGNRINDGAYAAMLEAIRNDATPNFYFMQYELATWSVRNLLLVPSFAFPTSAIIKRKPLAVTARRAGWVGCNIALNQIPADARIALVIDSKVTSEKAVRAQFRRVKPLGEIKATERGWTLDVLNAVRRLGKAQFTTSETYSFASELEKLHPDNRHVRDKIRQQLQVLRDRGFLAQVERGVWAVAR